MVNLVSIQATMTKRYEAMVITPAKVAAFKSIVTKIVANKPQYNLLTVTTHVPWWAIGIIHYREADLDMSRSIAQGDHWNKKSVNVPKGRGPFADFYDAAYDALANCPPKAAEWQDWSPGGALTLFEEYNGEGYENKGVPSPYIWAGTNQYVKGKYIADGRYDPNAVDTQLGCAGLMYYLLEFATLTNPNTPVQPQAMTPSPLQVALEPAPTPNAEKSWWEKIYG